MSEIMAANEAGSKCNNKSTKRSYLGKVLVLKCSFNMLSDLGITGDSIRSSLVEGLELELLLFHQLLDLETSIINITVSDSLDLEVSWGVFILLDSGADFKDSGVGSSGGFSDGISNVLGPQGFEVGEVSGEFIVEFDYLVVDVSLPICLLSCLSSK